MGRNSQANSIRITGGELRGRLIRVNHQQDGFRPAQSRVREAIFSSLGSEGRIEDACVLDLFSGAGTLGIEALSRGAAYVVFVEKHRDLSRDLGKNLAELGLDDKTAVVSEDIFKVPSKDLVKMAGKPFDLIFVDPPYKMEDADVEALITRLGMRSLLAECGLLIMGRDKRSKLDTSKMGDLAEKSRKVYGDSAIGYYTLA